MSVWFRIKGMGSIPTSCTNCVLYVQNCCPTLRSFYHTNDVVSKIYSSRRHEHCTLYDDTKASTSDYIPTCPRGYVDCVYDPAYIKRYHRPDMPQVEFEQMMDDCRLSFENDPGMKWSCYDNEDK